MRDEIGGAKKDVVMRVALINVGGQHIFILAPGHGVGQFFANLMRLLGRGFAGVKGLYQVMGEVIPFAHLRLVERELKLHIRCFVGAAERGYEQLFIGLFGVADIR